MPVLGQQERGAGRTLREKEEAIKEARPTCSLSEMNTESPPIYVNTVSAFDSDSVIMEPTHPLAHCRLLSECEKNARILEIRIRLFKDLIGEEEKNPSTDPTFGQGYLFEMTSIEESETYTAGHRKCNTLKEARK
ncbi:hypothetical protein TNCT_417901 [Trichonephila clavata]|uniref:Uncharacterized protein n=1 Tax=Trichonephila clavata TaxID=2740835 RepID=A0A8X6JMN3_TRICU|nr:hypothetical protein TNCT_417901 [Trichonephila clavata]